MSFLVLAVWCLHPSWRILATSPCLVLMLSSYVCSLPCCPSSVSSSSTCPPKGLLFGTLFRHFWLIVGGWSRGGAWVEPGWSLLFLGGACSGALCFRPNENVFFSNMGGSTLRHHACVIIINPETPLFSRGLANNSFRILKGGRGRSRTHRHTAAIILTRSRGRSRTHRRTAAIIAVVVVAVATFVVVVVETSSSTCTLLPSSSSLY